MRILQGRFTLEELCLYLTLFAFFIPWPLQVGPTQIVSNDAVSIILCIIIGLTFLKRLKFRILPSVQYFMGLFLLWQLWMTVSWIYHPYEKNTSQLVWQIFKSALVFSPYPIMGYILAKSFFILQRPFVLLIFVLSSMIAMIGIVQTVSGGQWLTGLLTNQRYLGLFTAIPTDYYENYILDLEFARMRTMDLFFVGSIYRAHGTFLHANIYSSFLVGISGFILAFLLTNARCKYGIIIVFILVILGLVASLGVAGALAFIAVSIYALVVRWPFVIKKIVFSSRFLLFLLCFTMIISGIIIFQPTIPEESPLIIRINRLIRPDQSGGFNGRVAAWSVIIDRIIASPLFGSQHPVTVGDVGWLGPSDTLIGAHNSYLAMGLFAGFPGMILFIVLFFLFLRRSWLIYRYGINVEMQRLGLACHFLFVSLAVVGIAQDWISDSSAGGLFWLCGGLSVTLAACVPKRVRYKKEESVPGSAVITS